MVLKCEQFVDEFVVGHVGQWDLSSGDLIKHNVSVNAVSFIALSGEMIVIADNFDTIRVFIVSTCLLFCLKYVVSDELRYS